MVEKGAILLDHSLLLLGSKWCEEMERREGASDLKSTFQGEGHLELIISSIKTLRVPIPKHGRLQSINSNGLAAI